MSFVEKYRNGLALILGTLCLIIAMYAPAKSALLLTPEEFPWKTSNWIFLGLGIIFLWGQIVTVAKAVQEAAKNFVNRKSEK